MIFEKNGLCTIASTHPDWSLAMGRYTDRLDHSLDSAAMVQAVDARSIPTRRGEEGKVGGFQTSSPLKPAAKQAGN